MALTETEIKRLAWLAKLKFTEEELAVLTENMAEIIEFADTINASVGTLPAGNDFARVCEFDDLRKDEVQESNLSEEVTSNIEAEDGFFPVRRRSL